MLRPSGRNTLEHSPIRLAGIVPDLLITITVMIGVVIPPVPMNVFAVKKITKVPFGVIYRGAVPFLAGLVLCAALLLLFPQLATLLPGLLMK